MLGTIYDAIRAASISELRISVRMERALPRLGIATVGELVARLDDIPAIGRRSQADTQEELREAVALFVGLKVLPLVRRGALQQKKEWKI